MTTQTRVCMSSHWQRINMGFAFFAASCVFVGTFLVAAFLFAGVANAQEVPADTAGQPASDEAGVIIQNESLPISSVAVVGVDAEVNEDVVAEEVLQDEQVTRQDLGAKDAAILPDSPFHIFKRFGRGLKETFTFDPVKKAEVKLQNASQEIYEAKKLIETKGVVDASAAKAIIKSTERFEAKLEDIAQATEGIKAQKVAAAPQVDQLIERVIDRQMKVEKVQDMIEEAVTEKASEKDMIAFKEGREKAVEHVGAVLVGVEENTEAIAARLNKVVEAQEGSDFKEIKNIEIIKKMGDKVPEGMKEAFEAAEQSSYQRLQGDIEEMPEEVRAKKLVKYTKQIKADDTRLLEITDELKQYNLPDDILKKIEEIKDIAVDKIAKDMEKMAAKDKLREKLMSRFTESDDFDDIRLMEDIQARMAFDEGDEFGLMMKKEMEQQHEQSVKQFMNRFSDADSQVQAEKFKELTKKMAKNPDPATFRALMKLEEEVRKDPTKAAFIDQMKDAGQKTRFAFEEKMKRQGDFFLDRVATSNPEDLMVMREFSDRFAGPPMVDFDFEAEFGEDFFVPQAFMPPGFGPDGFGPDGFGPPPFGDEFMPPGIGPDGFGPPPFMGPGFDPFAMFENKQKNFMQDHIAGMEDADAFRAMETRFREAAPDVVNEMQQFGNFKNVFNDKATMMQETKLRKEEEKLRKQSEQKRMQEEQEFFKQMQGVNDETERQRLMQEKNAMDQGRFEEDMKMQKEMMQKRMQFDPFCDSFCQQQRMQMMDNQFNQAKERFSQFAEEQTRTETQRFEQFKNVAPQMPMQQEGGFFNRLRSQQQSDQMMPPSGEQGGFFDRFRSPQTNMEGQPYMPPAGDEHMGPGPYGPEPYYPPEGNRPEGWVPPAYQPTPYEPTMPYEPYEPMPYMPPTDGHMPPTDGHMPPTDSYMPPTDSYMPPTDSYMPPTDSYMPPTDGHMPPTDSYMPPTDSYMPPTDSYMPPTDSYMPPTDSYMPPTDSYMPPTDRYVPMGNEYTSPMNEPMYEPTPMTEPMQPMDGGYMPPMEPMYDPYAGGQQPEPYMPMYEPTPMTEPMQPMDGGYMPPMEPMYEPAPMMEPMPMEPPPGEMTPPMEPVPMGSFWEHLARGIYNIITLPARAFGL